MPAVTPPPKKDGCWKWGIIGCLGLMVIAVIGIGAIVVIVFGSLKSTDVYRGALAKAQRDPRVIQALGSPVTSGFLIKGNVKNHHGEADIEFPIRGPKGEGQVHAVATRDAGGWHYTELTATPRGGLPIDLLRP